MATYLLFEAASGFALFESLGLDEVAGGADAVQKSVLEMERFGKICKLVSFQPFVDAADALEQCNGVSEGNLTQSLKGFLQMNLPKVKSGKKAKFTLGVADAKLGSAIQDGTSIPCVCNEKVGELLRGVRLHLHRFIKELKESDMDRARLGLAHSYSRSHVKFNVNRVDNMIIQAINLLDTLDKDINTFVMRVREWYSWHFPELIKIIPDNYQYTRICLVVKDKSTLTEEKLQEISEIVGDEDKAKEVIEAAKMSMGQDISPIDLMNIEAFANRVINLAEYRRNLFAYLVEKMHGVAPNLTALIGEVVGARLISHAGSLVNLAKYPASTVQILGAEKALFRALKTKGNTPKYGLIFHSSFIGRAQARNKGRISRYLANKCSIASRIDCFSDIQTSLFGEKMKEQVEERLSFYEQGTAPRKNIDVMHEAMESLPKVEKEEKKKKRKSTDGSETPKTDEKKKKKKSKSGMETPKSGEKERGSSKEKKRKSDVASEKKKKKDK